jgi:medium-chain acyl-[acyl-carrier-protein] hydrolase
MSNTREEKFRLYTDDVDHADKLTPAAAFNYFQEVAENHADELGMGRADMAAAGQTWILSRMSAILDRRAGRGSEIQVRTWPRGTDRLFAIRDYEMKDEADLIVARGRSAWLILDLTTLRPRRPETLTEGIPKNEGKDALADGAQGLPERKDLVEVGRRTAAYSDIDYNGHVNNARYVQWIQDALPAEEIEAADRLRLDINYLSEVKPGGTVSLWTGRIDGGWAIQGRHVDADTPAFRAELYLEIKK